MSFLKGPIRPWPAIAFSASGSVWVAGLLEPGWSHRRSPATSLPSGHDTEPVLLLRLDGHETCWLWCICGSRPHRAPRALGHPSGISRFPTHRETPLTESRVETWTQSILNPIHPHELPAAVDGTPNVTTFEYTEHINPFTGKPSRTWPLGKSRTNGATDPEAVGQSPPLH